MLSRLCGSNILPGNDLKLELPIVVDFDGKLEIGEGEPVAK
jgi:hypothetical protein